MTPDRAIEIRPDDLTGPEVRALLAEHLDDMYATSPAESVHALDLNALRDPAIAFFAAWDGAELLGCGALKDLGGGHVELKSMRASARMRGRGIGTVLLRFLLAEARARGFARVSLETGTEDYFAPARRLYRRHGFTECPPFGGYRIDPNSVFMTLSVGELTGS